MWMGFNPTICRTPSDGASLNLCLYAWNGLLLSPELDRFVWENDIHSNSQPVMIGGKPYASHSMLSFSNDVSFGWTCPSEESPLTFFSMIIRLEPNLTTKVVNSYSWLLNPIDWCNLYSSRCKNINNEQKQCTIAILSVLRRFQALTRTMVGHVDFWLVLEYLWLSTEIEDQNAYRNQNACHC